MTLHKITRGSWNLRAEVASPFMNDLTPFFFSSLRDAKEKEKKRGGKPPPHLANDRGLRYTVYTLRSAKKEKNAEILASLDNAWFASSHLKPEPSEWDVGSVERTF